MKLLICTLLIIIVGFSTGYAQSTEKITVPVLKENNKIDKLMDLVLNPNNKDKFERTNNSTDSCFLIYFFKEKTGNYIFQIEKNTKLVTDTLVNLMASRKFNFGYFRYKKYKVFIWANDLFYDFFNKTSETITFDFVSKLPNPLSLGNEHYLAIWHYQYENGRFSVEGPPPVMELEKN
ncbi:MAG TPA: hypothetical protein VK668_05185 [Mucilaginibacter sp.]|nr:hypothetical protein [Mucilaginibacter sp.]